MAGLAEVLRLSYICAAMPAAMAADRSERPRMTDAELEALADAMTLDEQVSLLAGQDFWTVNPIPRLGIGGLRVTDGPSGARGGGGLVGGVTAAAFPVGIALGASWDPDLAAGIGAAIATEARSKGAQMLLGPTVNLHRSVANGRNFECYSEDPELSAAIVAGYVTGLQGEGIAATVKHFVGNESETQRTTMSSDIDERSLRELYLRPFKAAVAAGAWGIMASYNRLNGTHTSEHAWLLTEVLRGDWGYDGIVMSDWFGTHSTAKALAAGLDLEMPGPSLFRGDTLLAALRDGSADPADVRASVLRMLRLMDRCGALDAREAQPERAEDRPEHRALIRRAGAEGAVLLKNDGLLPLAPPKGRVAVIGPNARVARIMGGGSAQLNPHYQVSPWDGLAARLGEENLAFAPGCTNHRFEPLWTGPIEAAFFDNLTLSGEPAHRETLPGAESFWVDPVADGKVRDGAFSARLTGTFTPAASGLHRFGVAAAGYAKLYLDGALVVDAATTWQPGRTYFEQGCDEVIAERRLEAGRACAVTLDFVSRAEATMRFSALRAGIGLPMGDAEIAEAARVAAGAETAILFVGRSGEWDTEGSDLPDIRLPGRQDDLVRAVLAANPRSVVVLQTGGPVEMPWLAEAPAVLQAWYPGQEAGHAIADMLFGDAEPAGRLPQSFPVRWQDNVTATDDAEIYPGRDGHVRYAEGVFTGHRHHDRSGIAPLFPFGHGLGYTDIDLGEMALAETPDGGITVTLPVTNTGPRAGSTVVQLYVGDDEASVPRPRRELKAFAKLRLAPGETRAVTLALPPRAFAFFDAAARCWRVEAGGFPLDAGFSAGDLRRHARVTRPALTLAP